MNAENRIVRRVSRPLLRRLDYAPCRYGSSKVLFRGPAKELRGDFVAFLGGTETFGRFVETPFPDLIETAMGTGTVNLGCMKAGIDAFLSSQSLVDICSMAKVTVVQIMGAANMSNRFYTVDPRHNERFLRASKMFKEIYPELDFSEFDQTSHLLTALARVAPARLHHVRSELQTSWVSRMRSLLAKIEGPKILLWLADHEPFSNARGGTICRDPLFIDRSMLDAVKSYADGVVEVCASQAEIEAGRGRLIYDTLEYSAAQEVLGPVVHERVAEALTPVLQGFLTATPTDKAADDAPLLLV